ncbi:hypothetical protein CR513_36185, partial [Mucuna pruriens]
MEMSNLTAKLKSLKLELGEDLIVHLNKKGRTLRVLQKGLLNERKLVELQLGKKIKAIKSDRSGEYYESLWEEALKIIVYILNRVPTKEMKEFFVEVEFRKEENIRNVVFEEEFVNDIGQVLVPITIQETTLVIGDNVQTIVLDIVPE